MNGYYHTPESVKEYISKAEGFDGKAIVQKLKLWLKPGSCILELGSGPGKDFALLKEDYIVTGSDYSLAFISHLQSIYPEESFLHLDAAQLTIDEKFDCIYSNKVLHHLSDAQLATSITSQAKVLNETGLVCHSFWAGKGEEVFKGMFVNYHSKTDLTTMFSHAFKPIFISTYAEFEEHDSVLVIAQKR